MRTLLILFVACSVPAADIATLFGAPAANATLIKQAVDQGGPKTAPVLIKQVQEQQNPQARDLALELLYGVAQPAHIPAIAEFAKDRQLRSRAISLLAILGREAPEPAITALQTLGHSPQALKVLGDLRAQAALPTLGILAQSDDPNATYVGLRGLAALGHPDSEATMRGLLKQADARWRALALLYAERASSTAICLEVLIDPKQPSQLRCRALSILTRIAPETAANSAIALPADAPLDLRRTSISAVPASPEGIRYLAGFANSALQLHVAEALRSLAVADEHVALRDEALKQLGEQE